MTELAPIAVILLARGGVYSAAASDLAQLAERVHEALAAQGSAPTRVQPAFADRLHPALPEALDACDAARTVVIVPVMSPDEPPLRRWLHKLVMRWRAGRADGPRLVFADPLLQTPQLPEMLACTVRRSLALPDVAAVPGSATPWAGPACPSIGTTCCGAWARAARPRAPCSSGRSSRRRCARRRPSRSA
jgi:hypothetical protein